MTKLTKKKKVIISVLVILAALLITAAIILALVFRPANIPDREDLGFETVCYELPDDNDPTSHTGVENIGYMNWRLQHQDCWYSEAHVSVINSMDNQNVSTYKQYNDGVLISTDISISNLVNKAVQYCQVRGGNVVLFRNSVGGKKAFNKIDTPWFTGKPDGHTISEYKVKKGLPPLEFSVYILNENTIKECSDVIDNGDGTYTQTFVLNFESDPMENDATYWYKTEMAYKANGMMKASPQFSEVSISYTFDNTWQVLSSHNSESYKTITGVGSVPCTSDGFTEYIYGDKERSYNPEFENYYANYLDDYDAPEDITIDAGLCLSEAFADFMQGEVKLALDLTVDGNKYPGSLQLNVPENDIRVDLGNVKVYMNSVGGEKYLYVAYGSDVKAKVALADITSALPASGSGGDMDGVLDSLLEALGDDDNFHLADDGLSATLSPSINLGEMLGIDLDIVLNLEFKFNISAEKAITLDYVKADGSLIGADFGARLVFSETGVPALTEAEAAGYTAIDVDGIASLISAEALKVQLSYCDNGVEVEGAITVNLNGLQVMADLQVVFDGAVDTAKHLSLAYADGTVYATLYSEGKQPAMLKANVDEAVEAISELFGITVPELQAQESDVLQTVLSLLEKIGTGNVINFLLSDDGLHSVIALSGTDNMVITVDGTALLEKLGVELELGEITAAIEKGGVVSLSALGLNANICGTDAFTIDKEEYKNASDLMPVFKKLAGAITDKRISVKGVLCLEVEGIAVELDIKLLSVDWSDGVALDISAVATVDQLTKEIYISYAGGQLKASVGNIGIELTDTDIDGILYAITEILTQADIIPDEGEGGLGDMFDALDELDIFSLIGALQISGSDNSIITLSLGGFEITIIDEVGKTEGGILGIEAEYSADGISLSLSGAYVTEYEPVVNDSEIQYFDGKYLIPLLNNVAKYVGDRGITLSATLEIGGVTITVDNLSISWLNGSAEIKAMLSVEFDTFAKTVYFEYSDEKAALYYDNIAVVLGKDDYDGFMSAVKSLIEVIIEEVGNGDATELPEVQNLLSIFTDTDAAFDSSDIFELLSSIGVVKNEKGNLVISFEGLTVELIVDGDGNLSANIIYGEGGLDASLAVGEYDPVAMPSGCAEIDAAEIISLINDVTQIISNKGIAVSGAISINIGNTAVKLTIYGLSVGWQNGIELQLDARIEVGSSVHDFYAEYSEATGRLKVVYGTLDGGAAIDINITEDAEGLEDALMAIYARIADLVNNTVDGDELILPELGSINELLDWIAAGIDTVRGVAELAEKVEGEEGPSIADILSGIQLDYKGGVLTVDVMGITLSLWRTGEDFYLSVQTEGVAFELSEVRIIATEYTDLGIDVENALTAEDIADVLDYLAATIELFVKDTFNISLSGTVTTTDEAYAQTGGVKYNISAGLDYQQGESGYPVHFVPEKETEDGGVTPPDFWIAPDIFVHLFVNMEATLPDVDSVLFDIYIFDGNPAVDSNGKTTSAALTSGDNELDVYMSISSISQNQANVANVTGAHEPLKIYAPMHEIMTVLSAGLALVDVGSISIDALPQLNGIITEIGSILDVMLVNRYFADTKDQFTSLGSSLLNNLLGGSLSDIINDLINGLAGVEEEVEDEVTEEAVYDAELSEGLERERFGVIDKLSVTRSENDTTLSLTVGQTTATVTKEAYVYTSGEGEDAVEYSGTRLKNLHVDESALNDTDTLNGLNIDFSYAGANKPSDLSGYMSIVGADELVKAVLNSSTHAVTAEDGTETYALNESFFIDGDITLDLPIVKDIKVTVDGLSVIFLEDGDAQIDFRLTYKNSGVVKAFNAGATVDVTVKDDVVFIKRVDENNQTIYRAMSVDAFLGDMMNQMFFILNFSDTIMGLIPSGDGSTSETAVKKDYGTQLGDILKSFNQSADTWSVVLNGKGISSLAGVNGLLSDVTLAINSKKTDDGNVIQGLTVNGSMFSIIGISANLDWQNPQDVWHTDASGATKQAKAAEIMSNGGFASFTNMLGNPNTFSANTDWKKQYFNTGSESVEMIFNGNQQASGASIDRITVNYYLQNAGVQLLETSTQNVFTSSGVICSDLNYPDVSGYAKEGYTLLWSEPVKNGEGTYDVYARYVNNNLKFTYYSLYGFKGSAVAGEVAGYDSAVYTMSGSLSSLVLGRTDYITCEEGANFVGWSYNGADGWQMIRTLADISEISSLDTVELHAVWLKVGVNVTDVAKVERTTGSLIKTYYYTFKYNISLNYEFVTVAGFDCNLTVADVAYRTYLTFNNPAPRYYATEQEYQNTTIGTHTGVLPCNHYSEVLSAADGTYAQFVSKELQKNSGANDFTTWNVVASFKIKLGDRVIKNIAESEKTYVNGSF